MMKKVLALVIMAMLFSFNCEKGCGMPKKEEAKEQPADQPTGETGSESETPAPEVK
jgi:hypothetical protein